MVKIGGSKKLSQKNVDFVEMGGIYKFCGNTRGYAISIIGLGGWTPLTAIQKQQFRVPGFTNNGHFHLAHWHRCKTEGQRCLQLV